MIICKPCPPLPIMQYDSEVRLCWHGLSACVPFQQKPCTVRIQMVREHSAEAPGLFLKNKKVCTCFVTAATAVQKLLAALRYLWGLRSAMAESSRGKLVLFFFLKLHQWHKDAHARPAIHPESLQACMQASVSQRFARFVFMYTYTVFIYIWVCVLSLVFGDLGKSRVNASGQKTTDLHTAGKETCKVWEGEKKKNEVRQRLMRSGHSAAEDEEEEEGGWAVRMGWRGREEQSGFKSVSHPLPALLGSQV